MRSTSGQSTCPPNMYRLLAIWFATSSMAHVTKSAKCISTTGRSPVIAAPRADPTIAASEMGAFRTRSGPNSSASPAFQGRLDAGRVGGVRKVPLFEDLPEAPHGIPASPFGDLVLAAVELGVALVVPKPPDGLGLP